jgi:predicted ATPase
MTKFNYRQNWHIITGGPSTGKTTLQEELAKLGYTTVAEAARLEIDDAVSLGITAEELREDEKHFQDDVVRRRVKLEAGVSPKETVILDRGMQDSLAYYRYYDFEIEPWVQELIDGVRYGLVFLMEPLGVLKRDYARTEVNDFNDYITDLLYDAYKEYGMEPIMVPAVSVEERLKIVLKHLKAYKPQKVAQA